MSLLITHITALQYPYNTRINTIQLNPYYALSGVRFFVPSVSSFSNALAKSVKNAFWSFAYSRTYFLNFSSSISAMSLGNIIRLPLGSLYWNFALVSSGVHSSPFRSTKYELLKSKGVPDHGPTYPDASVIVNVKCQSCMGK